MTNIEIFDKTGKLPTKKKFWLSCKNFTIYAGVDGINRITEAAPIARKFIGQPLENLEKWMKKFGDFRKELLNENI